ncbi:N-acetylglucosamine-6-phosphate deacetylase [Spiroplasma endosymbiont of Amphibalanus improvisus]|uniref:N-acetylglucosamine-6-phosphate deacetylase n=1 Tax=Spiroplasma endosymbiont of Amphibalanus improvisus TaxID=3066327 RepID=UPI00313E9040
MILYNAKIILEEKVINEGWLEIEDSQIKSINEGKYKGDGIDLKNKVILPGFIDCHVHGGYGYDFESSDSAKFSAFAKKIASEGVTKYCQATVAQPYDLIESSLSNYAIWMNTENKGPQARQIGAHLEGPFISEEKRGAHKVEYLKDADKKVFQKWIKASDKNIRLITYAIERDKSNFTNFLLKNNVLPSVGHTNTTAKYFKAEGVDKGVTHVTHLFNAMSGVQQHNPGVATQSLIDDRVVCELISDGIHVKEEVIKLIYRSKGFQKIIIVTDAMNAKGMPDGDYKLGPLDVEKHGQKVTLKGTDILAGSGATYDHCFRTMKKINDLDYSQMIYMSSINVSKQLNIFEQTGSIAVGKLADLVVLDKKDEVYLTITEGEIAFKNNK